MNKNGRISLLSSLNLILIIQIEKAYGLLFSETFVIDILILKLSIQHITMYMTNSIENYNYRKFKISQNMQVFILKLLIILNKYYGR